MTGKNPVPRSTARRGRIVGPATLLLLAGTLTACGGNSPAASSSSTPAGAGGTFDTASAAAAVKQTWTTFFSKDTPIAQKETLLQNGTSTFAPAVQAFAANPMVGEVTANVQNVTFPSPTKADVSYSIALGGAVVENAMAGSAVYQNGKWLVADTTLCATRRASSSS